MEFKVQTQFGNKKVFLNNELVATFNTDLGYQMFVAGVFATRQYELFDVEQQCYVVADIAKLKI